MQVQQHDRARHGDEGQAEDADDGCPAGDPGVQVGVTQVEPGKAREQPTSKPLEQYPQHRETQQHAAGQRPDPAHVAPGEKRVQQGEAGAERQRQKSRQGYAGVTVNMNTDIHPGGSGAKQAQTVEPAAPDRLARVAETQQVAVQGAAYYPQGPE